MGVMKRIATELVMNKSLSRFAPGERAAIRNLIRTSEGLLRFMAEEAAPPPTAGGFAMDDVFVRVVFTGFKPERAGVYMVVDLVSETEELVRLFLDQSKTWMVQRPGDARQERLDDFNRKHHRWFRLAELGVDDLAFIRKDLPSVAVTGA